jgi:putative ABC transport system permease protein
LQDAWRDVRFGVRGFVKTPAATLIAVLSLAVGIGATSAIASVIDVLLLRALPVERPHELVVIERHYPGRGSVDYVPYPTFARVRDAGIFANTTASMVAERSGVSIGSEVATLKIGLVSGTYFETLGVHAHRGRTLEASDDRSGAEAVGVISAACWQREFGGTADAVGRMLTLNGFVIRIVGVADPSFTGEDLDVVTDVWIPVVHQERVIAERPGLLQNDNSNWIRAIGRLKAGQTIEQAHAAVRALTGTLPATNPAFGASQMDVAPAGHGFTPQREVLSTPLTVLAVIVTLVLLMACANVAMLLLARGTAREKEITTRLALGAGRGRLVRQLVIEGLTLAVAGGLTGCVISIAMTRALGAVAASGRAAFAVSVNPDVRMLAGAAAISLTTGLLFALLPALHSTRVSLVRSMATAGGSTASRWRLFGGRILVVGQIAVSVMLLAGAGLLVRTLTNLETRHLGFDRDRVLLFWMSTGESGRQQAELAADFDAVEQRVAAIEGVVSVSPSSDGVLSGFVGLRAVAPIGQAPIINEDTNAQWNLVGPRFFSTVGMPLVAGRDFGLQDTDRSSRVAIVNETMAHRFFNDARPLGKRFGFGRDLSAPIEIVGVVKDATYFSARDEATPMVFLPYRQDVPHLYRLCVAVRVTAVSSGLIARIRATLGDIDPAVPVRLVTTTADQVNRTLSTERLTAGLGAVFGVAAILLACLGTFGVTSYTVARRTREIGVRIALGETRSQVLARVLRQNMLNALIGAAIGLAAAIVGAGYIRSLLYGVTATDPLTLAAAGLAAVAVALLGALVPAARAASLDPLVALRTD